MFNVYTFWHIHLPKLSESLWYWLLSGHKECSTMEQNRMQERKWKKKALELLHTDLETKPTDPGLYSLQWIMLSIVPAVSPILKAPAWIPPTVAGPITTWKLYDHSSEYCLFIFIVSAIKKTLYLLSNLVVCSCIRNQLLSVWLRYTFSNDCNNSNRWLLQSSHGGSGSTADMSTYIQDLNSALQ